jgi:hypothetical protein
MVYHIRPNANWNFLLERDFCWNAMHRVPTKIHQPSASRQKLDASHPNTLHQSSIFALLLWIRAIFEANF